MRGENTLKIAPRITTDVQNFESGASKFCTEWLGQTGGLGSSWALELGSFLPAWCRVAEVCEEIPREADFTEPPAIGPPGGRGVACSRQRVRGQLHTHSEHHLAVLVAVRAKFRRRDGCAECW